MYKKVFLKKNKVFFGVCLVSLKLLFFLKFIWLKVSRYVKNQLMQNVFAL